MPNIDELMLLIRSRHPIITIETVEESRAVTLVRETCEAMNVPMYVWTCVEGLKRIIPPGEPPTPRTEKAEQALAHLGVQGINGVYVFKDLSAHLDNPLVQRLLRDLAHYFGRDERTIVLIDHDTTLPPALERLAAPFELHPPDDDEIERIVRRTFSELSQFSKVTAKITKSDLHAIVTSLRSLTEDEIVHAVTRAVMDDDQLDAADIPRLLDYKRTVFLHGGVLEYVPATREKGQIGGLGNLKGWLRKREGSLSPAAVEFGLDSPRGILLLGVQGCGKSLAAKMVAAAWGLPLLRLDPGTLYDKYVGETEKRLRQAFRIAESTAPAVLWIDEIEKGFASAAAQSTDGGLSKRMFGTLLGWMQDHRAPIFCVATANDISALPPELLRKGRFDEIFFVDLPGPAARERVFAIHLLRRKRKPENFDLAALAAASEGFSGAEIEQAITSAMFTAFADKTDLSQAHLVDELAATHPLSVTMAERIDSLRQWASSRCVPAD